MKAIYYPAWDQMELRDVPEPSAKAGEAVVRVKAVGICGSELHGFAVHAARRTPPTILGHEFCGEILSVGEGVTGFKPGDRVGVNSVISCAKCPDCHDGNVHLCRENEVFGMKRPGGFAEQCAVPAASLLHLPAALTPMQGSLLEPLANGVHAVSMLQQRFPETVAVFGAGTIGLFALQVASISGAIRLIVVDTHDARLGMARRLGASAVLNPKKADVVAMIRSMTGGRGADVTIDAVGAAETRRASVSAVRRGGEVVWIGLHDDPSQISGFQMVLGERKIYGSFAVTHRDLRTAIALFANGKITLEPWVRTFPLAQGVEVFLGLVHNPPDDYIKAVLLP